MGVALVLGCVGLAFAPAIAIFLVLIARDPLRIIIFVLGAFFWLVSFLLSSLVWFAVYPLRDSNIWFALVFTVIFQELMRVAFFYMLKLAERGLAKVAAQGMRILGVHSLINARHVVALVCGLGYGVMGGLFGITNIIADSQGPGAPGLPDVLHTDPTPLPLKRVPFYFAAISSASMTSVLTNYILGVSVCAMILHQLCWMVIMWNGLHYWRLHRNQLIIEPSEPLRQPHYMCYVEMGMTIFTHYFVVFCSLMNEIGYWPIYLLMTYFVLIFNAGWALRISGMKWSTLCGTLRHVQWVRAARTESPTPPTQHTTAMSSNTSVVQRNTEVRQRGAATVTTTAPEQPQASASGAIC